MCEQMKKATKVGELIRKLLIENEMDGFSITEARNAFLNLEETSNDLIEARKQVYRLILRFEKSGLLFSEGSGRNKKYFLSEAFRQQFILQVSPNELDTEQRANISDYSVLVNERNEHSAELEITLNEINEYRSLISRFPDLEKRVMPLLQESKERSVSLLGKVNAFTHVISVLSEGEASC